MHLVIRVTKDSLSDALYLVNVLLLILSPFRLLYQQFFYKTKVLLNPAAPTHKSLPGSTKQHKIKHKQAVISSSTPTTDVTAEGDPSSSQGVGDAAVNISASERCWRRPSSRSSRWRGVPRLKTRYQEIRHRIRSSGESSRTEAHHPPGCLFLGKDHLNFPACPKYSSRGLIDFVCTHRSPFSSCFRSQNSYRNWQDRDGVRGHSPGCHWSRTQPCRDRPMGCHMSYTMASF